MKIEKNDDLFVVYVNNDFNTSFLNKDELQEFFKRILFRIKHKYKNIDSGIYVCTMYVDFSYGIVVEIYCDSKIEFLDNVYEVKIAVDRDSKMMFCYDDFFMINSKNMYKYEDKFYVFCSDVSYDERLVQGDFYKVVYGDRVREVLREGRLIKI